MGMTQTEILAQFFLQIFLNFGLPILILVAVVAGYTWFVKRLDREVEVRALQAVARRRVERRKNARARNLQAATASREIAKR